MKKGTIFILSLILTATNFIYAQLITPDAQLRTGKLKNGLTYYLRHNEVPKGSANFYLVQKVGSVLEEENQRGLAHFLEHMAFNGTKHFPGNTMVKELEKKGIRFGNNINAYTSFDETVYNLTNVPVGREGVIDTALLVLHDWSGFITNDDTDIDEERGIIREEWRTRSSGSRRVLENEVMPVLFAGTPYANRLPIGTLDVINNFKPKELKDYYKKWYRPDLQAVVIVGDIDVELVEKKLIRLFADVPAPVNPAPRIYFPVPDNVTPLIAIASDPEIQSASATVHWKMDNTPANQKADRQYFKVKIINGLISNMLNQRFADLSNKERAAFSSASCSMGQFMVASTKMAWSVSVASIDNDLPKALRAILEESERMRRFGFNLNEFEPTIKNFNLASNEKEYFDRDVRRNIQLTNMFVQHFLKNEPLPDPEWQYKAQKEILNGLTMDTINFYVKQYVKDHNVAFEIIYPGKGNIKLPTAVEITAIWEDVKRMELSPWIKKIEPSDLAKLVTPVAGKIIKTAKDAAPFGYTKWELSNGVKVWFKDTKYPESDIYVNAYKPGGINTVPVKDLPTALAFNNVSRLKGGLEGFDGTAQASCILQKEQAFLYGQGTIMNLEKLFQYMYMKMTGFKRDDEVFNNWKIAQLETIKSRAVNPKTVFDDTIALVMSNHSARALSLNDPEVLKKVDYETIWRLHKQYFQNARDFTFIITGNVREDSIRPLVETWLGGLPSAKKKESLKAKPVYPPKGIVKKNFSRKMETPQSSISIIYSGALPSTLENQLLMNFTIDVLSTVYLETIREKEGGSYGVAVRAEVGRTDPGRYTFQVLFDTDPDPVKKQKLISIVYNEIQKIIKEGPIVSMVDKVKTTFLKNYKESRKKEDAIYWFSISSYYFLTGIDRRTNFEKVVTAITPKMIQEFSRKIFSQGNIIEVVMDPEGR